MWRHVLPCNHPSQYGTREENTSSPVPPSRPALPASGARPALGHSGLVGLPETLRWTRLTDGPLGAEGEAAATIWPMGCFRHCSAERTLAAPCSAAASQMQTLCCSDSDGMWLGASGRTQRMHGSSLLVFGGAYSEVIKDTNCHQEKCLSSLYRCDLGTHPSCRFEPRVVYCTATAPTSAPGLRSPLPHLHRDWVRLRVCRSSVPLHGDPQDPLYRVHHRSCEVTGKAVQVPRHSLGMR